MSTSAVLSQQADLNGPLEASEAFQQRTRRFPPSLNRIKPIWRCNAWMMVVNGICSAKPLSELRGEDRGLCCEETKFEIRRIYFNRVSQPIQAFYRLALHIRRLGLSVAC